MSGASEPLDSGHQELLQFLYQFPVGVIEMNECGEVQTMNPAASRLLSTELMDGESVTDPLPVLRRLVPDLMDELSGEPASLGAIGAGREENVDSRDGTTRFTVSAHRLRTDKIFVSLTDITEERRLLTEQRTRARRLQRALLGSVDENDLDLSVAYHAAHREDLSGGDWNDVIAVDTDRFALVVGDVVGHDIEASATMGQLRAIVRAVALIDPEPNLVLRRTETLARTIDGAACASISYVLLDRSSGVVSYANAGHPPPVIARVDGSTDVLDEAVQPVLAAVDAHEFEAATSHLGSGDVLVMYTDGLVERRSETLDVGIERLTRAATEARVLDTVDEIVARLVTTMLEGTNHHDDVCVLAVRHRPTG